jgi:hypothetical protein
MLTRALWADAIVEALAESYLREKGLISEDVMEEEEEVHHDRDAIRRVC